MIKLNFLFIEDSQIDVEIVIWELKKRGVFVDYQIVETENELIWSLQNNLFDLIISDHNMPCLNSLEAFAICNKIAPLVPFIVLSMHITEDVKSSLLSNNVNAVFYKYDMDCFYEGILKLFIEKRQPNS